MALLTRMPRLPELPHKIVLGLFGLAFLAGFIALLSVRWPAREEAIRRVESISGIGSTFFFSVPVELKTASTLAPVGDEG